MDICSLNAKEVENREVLGLAGASLAKMVSSRFNERLCHKKNKMEKD